MQGKTKQDLDKGCDFSDAFAKYEYHSKLKNSDELTGVSSKGSDNHLPTPKQSILSKDCEQIEVQDLSSYILDDLNDKYEIQSTLGKGSYGSVI